MLEITERCSARTRTTGRPSTARGVALAGLDKPDEAARRFRALLDLRVADDEKSAIVKARTRDPKLQAAGARPSRYQPPASRSRSRTGSARPSQIRMATRLETRVTY